MGTKKPAPGAPSESEPAGSKPTSALNTDQVAAVLRACVDVTPDVYFVKDWEHRLLLVSRSLAVSMGRTSSEMEGHLDSDFWSIEACEPDEATGRAGYHAEDRAALAGKATRSTERVVLDDGTEHIFQTDRIPLRDPSGRVSAILGFARDVSAPILLERRTQELETITAELRVTNHELSREVKARREAQSDLESANTELETRVRDRTRALTQKVLDLERSEARGHDLAAQLQQTQKLEALGRLAGGIAHDFNNVLQIVTTGLEFVYDDLVGNEPLQNEVDLILRAAQRAESLTSKLLAFARKHPVRPETFNVNDAIEPLIAMLRRIVEDSVHIRFEPTPQACLISLDTGQLDQLMTNLIINARDAIEEGGEIVIRTSIVKGSDSTANSIVRIEVEDNGKGMDEHTLSTIFEPFFSTKKNGTGLGLSIVYGIVSQHGGKIWLSSDPGRGTLATIEFQQQFIESRPEPRSRRTSDRPSSPLRIVIVEDEFLILQALARMFERSGDEVQLAHGSREALEVLDALADPIDLLITDVSMPEITGREVARRFREKFPQLPVLYMSGYTAGAVENDALLGPHDHYIQKPFSLHRMRELVKGIVAPVP